MSALCIIPARGGSKRIPRKNIRLLHGRPAIAWTIETALAAGLFDEVMVSTEDEEIATVARQAGATVPFMRSAQTSTDHATTMDVLREVLGSYAALGTKPFELVCCIYPTAVLIEPEHLQAGHRALTEHPHLDSAMAVQAYRHPIERGYRLEDELLRQINPAQYAIRTQDLAPAFFDAGQFYWFRPQRMEATRSVLGDRCTPVTLEAWQAIDLDTESDWQFLERLTASRAMVGGEVGGA